MLRSAICLLTRVDRYYLPSLGECEYDEGGYFIINGGEKVIIAQEKMSTNHVYVFKVCHYSFAIALDQCLTPFQGGEGAKYSYIAEIRSVPEGLFRPARTLYVRLHQRHNSKIIRAQIPYVRDEVPIVILFRALNFLTDRDILDHIVYNLEDHRMMEMLRPSLEEGFVIQRREVSFIESIITSNNCIHNFFTPLGRTRIYWWSRHCGCWCAQR